MKRCTQCGTKIGRKAKFCPGCGVIIVTDESGNQNAEHMKSRVIIIVLCALLVVSLCAVCFLLVRNGNDSYEKFDTQVSPTVSAGGFTDDPERIEEAARSVIKLNCYDENGELVATGSGFAAFEKGVIVTNYHVIADYPSRIEIETEKGQKCDIFGGIGVSKERDIAILYYQHRTANIDIPVLTVNTTKQLNKGEKVVAIGSPLGLTNVVSAGVFSGYTNVTGSTEIQFTASISSGSSGGALISDDGEVIGITYASMEAGQNLNFAVPIGFVNSLWRRESSDRCPLQSFYALLQEGKSPREILGLDI